MHRLSTPCGRLTLAEAHRASQKRPCSGPAWQVPAALGVPDWPCDCLRVPAAGAVSSAASTTTTVHVDANGDGVPDIVTISTIGITVAQTLLYQGKPDFFLPLHACGDGVVWWLNEYCDALPGESPYASE